MAPPREPHQTLTATDGTQLAYQLEGDGPPLVLINGLTTTTHFWKYLRPAWRAEHRLLTWDMPGHGRSGAPASSASATISGQVELLRQLMDGANIGRAVLVGWSTGCQVALEMYRRHPGRCRALVLLIGTPGRVLTSSQLPVPGWAIAATAQHLPPPLFGSLTRTCAKLARTRFGQMVPRHLGLIGAGTSTHDAAEITAHLTRLDSTTAQTMLLSAQAHSAWDMLHTIQVPTLIVAGDKDPFAPADTVSESMAAMIPGAQLRRLPEGTHTALLDHAAEIEATVSGFLSHLPRQAT